MHNLSNNKYIHSRDSGAYNLNKFLFGESVPPKAVSGEQFTLAVHDLLDSLGFALYLTGYKFLAHITELYLIQDDYTLDGAIKSTSDAYRTTEKRVIDNILTSIRENKSFIPMSCRLLLRRIDCITTNTIGDAVEILGAVFEKYYNYYLR